MRVFPGRFGRSAIRAAVCLCVFSFMRLGVAQQTTSERVFPQSKSQVEKALRTLQSSTSGRLPSLEGFAQSSQHPLSQYERGFFEASVDVTSLPSGGTRVRVNVKVTAWYKNPDTSHSGYQLLASNGRIESDLLDQLSEQLAAAPGARVGSTASAAPAAKEPANAGDWVAPAREAPVTEKAAQPQPSTLPTSTAVAQPAAEHTEITAPAPRLPDSGETFASSLSQGLAAQGMASKNSSPSDANNPDLRQQAEDLEELLRNQVHPTNLVAVKKSGTPVLDSPSLNGKALFMASAHDEFEMLDHNEDWVHVRISGLSRGWIWRNSLELPGGIEESDSPASEALKTAQDLFSVEREETGQFPGDWSPLRGKNVRILSVQDSGNKAKQAGSKDRLEFAKYLFEKHFRQVSGTQQDLAGIVVIFDSVEGGMVAATSATLEKWRSGTLSDAAMWHECFFDPPETFDSAGNSGSK